MVVTVLSLYSDGFNPLDDVYIVSVVGVEGYPNPLSVRSTRKMHRGQRYQVTLPSPRQCQRLYNNDQYPLIEDAIHIL